MTKILRCKDVGGSECDFEATGETVEEIMQKAAQHAKEAHGMDEIPPDVAEACQKAIQDI